MFCLGDQMQFRFLLIRGEIQWAIATGRLAKLRAPPRVVSGLCVLCERARKCLSEDKSQQASLVRGGSGIFP